eukprot:gene12679-biopygen12495
MGGHGEGGIVGTRRRRRRNGWENIANRGNAAPQAPPEGKKRGTEAIAAPKALPIVGTSSGHTQRRPPFNCICAGRAAASAPAVVARAARRREARPRGTPSTCICSRYAPLPSSGRAVPTRPAHWSRAVAPTNPPLAQLLADERAEAERLRRALRGGRGSMQRAHCLVGALCCVVDTVCAPLDRHRLFVVCSMGTPEFG